MTDLAAPRLVNDPFGDPGLFLDLPWGRRALLFDLGDTAPLSARELLRVTDVVVTHRHMDHFTGFDRLLRLSLSRPRTIRLLGPPGLIAGVRAKLDAYDWNLLSDRSPDFALHVGEVSENRPAALFRARDAFAASPAPALPTEHRDFRLETVLLDHGLPCLAVALQELLRVNVSTEGLARLGLAVGPWLGPAKTAARAGLPDDAPVETPNGLLPLGALREAAFRTAPGQRVTYVTDAAFTPQNAARIRALARDADHLFIEAAFLHEDEALARARHHLTARQAGTLAREAGARRLSVFHHSPRYLDRPHALREEAQAAFAAP